jgi:hypothetical protein
VVPAVARPGRAPPPAVVTGGVCCRSQEHRLRELSVAAGRRNRRVGAPAQLALCPRLLRRPLRSPLATSIAEAATPPRFGPPRRPTAPKLRRGTPPHVHHIPPPRPAKARYRHLQDTPSGASSVAVPWEPPTARAWPLTLRVWRGVRSRLLSASRAASGPPERHQCQQNRVRQGLTTWKRGACGSSGELVRWMGGSSAHEGTMPGWCGDFGQGGCVCPPQAML